TAPGVETLRLGGLDEVRELLHHAAHRRRVLALHHLVQSPQPQTTHGGPLLLRKADDAADHPDAQAAGAPGLCLALGHGRVIPPSAAPEPARRAPRPVGAGPDASRPARLSPA